MLPGDAGLLEKVVHKLSPRSPSNRGAVKGLASASVPHYVRKFAWEVEHDLEFEAHLLRHRKTVGIITIHFSLVTLLRIAAHA